MLNLAAEDERIETVVVYHPESERDSPNQLRLAQVEFDSTNNSRMKNWRE
jgi:hypothetical protein